MIEIQFYQMLETGQLESPCPRKNSLPSGANPELVQMHLVRLNCNPLPGMSILDLWLLVDYSSKIL